MCSGREFNQSSTCEEDPDLRRGFSAELEKKEGKNAWINRGPTVMPVKTGKVRKFDVRKISGKSVTDQEIQLVSSILFKHLIRFITYVDFFNQTSVHLFEQKIRKSCLKYVSKN